MTAIGEMTSLAERKRHAGQRLVIGFEGTSVTDDLRRLVAMVQPAGFILFARNVEEPAQVRELNRELASLVDPHRPALLSVDQEGGRVQRVRAPATVWPAMRALGQSEALTEAVSRAMARELRALGFNLNFAPVADVDSNPDNPVIGDRSFSTRAEAVAEAVVRFLTAHQDEGVISCAKHFPGHGDTHLDSHLALPTVDRDERSLLETELVPFEAACRAGVGTVMTAHVRFPVWDDLPATLSSVILPRFLRERMDFDGVVFSDDLEMKAVAGRWPVPEIVRLATNATVDILLCCKRPELQLEAFEAMVRAQEQDAAFEGATQRSVKRVDALRERFFLPPRPPLDLDALATDDHLALAAEVSRRFHG